MMLLSEIRRIKKLFTKPSKFKRHIAFHTKTFKIRLFFSDALPADFNNFVHFPVSPFLV